MTGEAKARLRTAISDFGLAEAMAKLQLADGYKTGIMLAIKDSNDDLKGWIKATFVDAGQFIADVEALLTASEKS